MTTAPGLHSHLQLQPSSTKPILLMRADCFCLNPSASDIMLAVHGPGAQNWPWGTMEGRGSGCSVFCFGNISMKGAEVLG
ncbi:hypothetical protein N7468_004805 [Penicillium chermesinum]|uniref:Uncharacterized protein n=1 Tax=Penicillium chermesinum TaxID=63820 RepID=A0A9W9TSX5_9EURO|nr:uncharacterized protein N7468_004805 [Penicillium chermesinum]KAJ5240186.1 hypothetical protein N7468_004805 [Penicillium chermesinum]